MAKVLAQDESNEHRAAELRHIQAGWERMKDKAYTLLYDL